jgi:hypothetical protein
MRGQQASSTTLQARGLRRVTVLVPAGCAEGLRQLARELRARQRDGTAASMLGWRRLSPSAELFVDPASGARCAVRDTGAITAMSGDPTPPSTGTVTEPYALPLSSPGSHRRNRHGRNRWSGGGLTFFHVLDAGAADRCDCVGERLCCPIVRRVQVERVRDGCEGERRP